MPLSRNGGAKLRFSPCLASSSASFLHHCPPFLRRCTSFLHFCPFFLHFRSPFLHFRPCVLRQSLSFSHPKLSLSLHSFPFHLLIRLVQHQLASLLHRFNSLSRQANNILPQARYLLYRPNLVPRQLASILCPNRLQLINFNRHSLNISCPHSNLSRHLTRNRRHPTKVPRHEAMVVSASNEFQKASSHQQQGI